MGIGAQPAGPAARLLWLFLLLWLSVGCCGAADLPPAQRELWSRRDTVLLASGLAGAGAIAFLDEAIRRESQRHRSSGLDTAADTIDLLGHPLTVAGIAGSIWAAGSLRGDPELATTGRMALEAIIAAEAATLALKAGTGRLRPGPEEDAWSFRPFSLADQHDAFPSGHAAGSFALASVLSRRSEHPLAPWLCYGAAGVVGLTRIYQDDHWTSDVLVGALLGELAGRMVIAWHEPNSGPRLLPVAGGAVIAWSGAW